MKLQKCLQLLQMPKQPLVYCQDHFYSEYQYLQKWKPQYQQYPIPVKTSIPNTRYCLCLLSSLKIHWVFFFAFQVSLPDRGGLTEPLHVNRQEAPCFQLKWCAWARCWESPAAAWPWWRSPSSCWRHSRWSPAISHRTTFEFGWLFHFDSVYWWFPAASDEPSRVSKGHTPSQPEES